MFYKAKQVILFDVQFQSFLVSGRKKTQAEEAEDLLKQFSAEAQLVKQFNETSIDVDKQIEERLRRLKADTASLTPQTNPISAKVSSTSHLLTTIRIGIR